MKANKCCNETMRNVGLLALRVAVGLVFVVHGWAKLNGIEGFAEMLTGSGMPAATLVAWVVALVEFLGGLAILLGFYTSMAAKVLVVEMIFALLLVHTKMPWAAAEMAILALGGSLALAGLGGGKWKVSKMDCPCEGKK